MPALRRRTAVALLLLAATAVGAWLGFTALRAQRALVDARADLAVARAALSDRQLEPARAALQRAGERTRAARTATSDPLWRLAAAVPRLGRSLATVRGLAAGADDLAREVLPEALAVAEGIDVDRLRSPDGRIDVALLRGVQPGAARSAGAASAVAGRLAELPAGYVVAPVARARSELTKQAEELVSALTGADAALRLAPVLLGDDRARRYLVLVQQTSESRGTGGIAGGFLYLEAAGGRLRVLDQGSNAGLRNTGLIAPPAGVAPEFVELYDNLRVFEFWQNANVSPDLTVGARIFAARWAAQGGGPLDGVAVVDAVALSEVLRGSPPLEIGGRTVPVEQLGQYLGLDQYRLPGATFTDPGAGTLERKEQLEGVLATASTRLIGGAGDTLALLRGLATAVRSGHARMASDDPALGPLLADAGVDGALPDAGPVAYPVVNNITEGKLDYFLRRSVSYQVGPCAGKVRRSTVTVRLLSDVPGGELPPYVTIRRQASGLPIVSSRVNAVSLSVYTTRGARLVRATVDGVEPDPLGPGGEFVLEEQEAGVPFWNVELDLPPGQERTVALELEEPVVPGAPRVVEQPLAVPLVARVFGPACR